MDAAEVRQEIAERGQAYVSEATGFDQGDEFTSEAQVRDYFTVANVRAMLGECPYTQEGLDLMAEAVIDGGWHMAYLRCEACERIVEGVRATETVEVCCPECGGTWTLHLCDQCATETRQAPSEALWCAACRRSAAMR